MTVRAVAPLAARPTGSCPAAWTASLWNGTPNSRATAASSATGWTVPTSLLAHMTLARATLAGSCSIAARRSPGSVRPAGETGSQVTSAPSWLASQSTLSSTAWCSVRGTSTRRRAGSAARRDQNSPLMARLSASVPPLVNTTSLGRAP